MQPQKTSSWLFRSGDSVIAKPSQLGTIRECEKQREFLFKAAVPDMPETSVHERQGRNQATDLILPRILFNSIDSNQFYNSIDPRTEQNRCKNRALLLLGADVMATMIFSVRFD